MKWTTRWGLMTRDSSRLKRPGLRFFRQFALYTLVLAFLSFFLYREVHNRVSPFTTGFLLPTRLLCHRFAAAAPRGEEVWLQLLKKDVPRSLYSQDFGDGGAFQTGGRLPTVLSDPWPSNLWLTDKLQDGKFVVRSLREYSFSLKLFYGVHGLVAIDSRAFAKWLMLQSNTLPPRRIDSLVYLCATEASWDKCPASFWVETGSEWHAMVKGSNPVYRLLALENACRWSRNAQELHEVCLQAHKEDDCYFRDVARFVLASVLRSGRIGVVTASPTESPSGSLSPEEVCMLTVLLGSLEDK